MKMSLLGIALAAAATVATPTLAEARDHYGAYERSYDDGYRDYDRGYDRGGYRRDGYYRGGYGRYADRGYYYRGGRSYRDCRSGGTTGLVLGGVAGALLGRSIDRYGDRTPGTVLGAGAGALLGREVDRGGRC